MSVQMVGLKILRAADGSAYLEGEIGGGQKLVVVPNRLRPEGLRGKRTGANKFDYVAILLDDKRGEKPVWKPPLDASSLWVPKQAGSDENPQPNAEEMDFNFPGNEPS